MRSSAPSACRIRYPSKVPFAFLFAVLAITAPYRSDHLPPDSIREIALEKADLYGADFPRMWATVECEDPALDPLQQSQVADPDGPGGKENSWGLTQIDLDYNQGISKEEAEDPYFSLDLMARNFSEGRAFLYHCYTHLFPK